MLAAYSIWKEKHPLNMFNKTKQQMEERVFLPNPYYATLNP